MKINKIEYFIIFLEEYIPINNMISFEKWDLKNYIFLINIQKDPIIHRDMKIENILKFGKNYKICDFDSVTTEVFNPQTSNEKTKNKCFKDFESNCTLYYRAPEICDKYSEYIINEKIDIW